MTENQINQARTLLQKFNKLWGSGCITLSHMAEYHEEANVNDFRQEVNEFLQDSHLGIVCDHCDEEIDYDCECEFCDTCDWWVEPGEPCISCNEYDDEGGCMGDDPCDDCCEYECTCDEMCDDCHGFDCVCEDDKENGAVSQPLNAFHRARYLKSKE